MSRQNKKIEKNCLMCNKVFFTYDFAIKCGRGKFCSIKCRGMKKTKIKNSPEYFWSQIYVKEDKNLCWEWKKCKDQDGYGLFLYNSNIQRSHRLSYFFTFPEKYTEENKKLFILHTCDNPPCCNPYHLFLGTPKQNTEDMVNKNRQAKGKTSGMSKLDEFDVKQILLLKNVLKRQTIAEMYKIGKDCINSIFNNKTWKHVNRNI